MKVGGQILWNVTPICGRSQVHCLMGKTPYERRFGQPFKGPIIPFGSLVEVSSYHWLKYPNVVLLTRTTSLHS